MLGHLLIGIARVVSQHDHFELERAERVESLTDQALVQSGLDGLGNDVEAGCRRCWTTSGMPLLSANPVYCSAVSDGHDPAEG